MADVRMSVEEYLQLLNKIETAMDKTTEVAAVAVPVAKKAKKQISRYNREFGKQLKRLKAKHKRTKVKDLMKRAHKETKKVLKK